MVRIIHYKEEAPLPDVWEVREKFVTQYGTLDFVTPPRRTEAPKNPFAND